MSKIKRRYVENYICGFEEIELTSDMVIEKPDEYSKYYLDPNGSNRSVTFNGSDFVKGDTYIIHNVGTSGNVITITNSSTDVGMNERYEFIYNDIVWKAYKLFGNQSAGSEVTTFQQVFQHENGGYTRWLSHEGDTSIPSNNVPAIIPWRSNLLGVTFTNKYEADVDIEIYREGTSSWNVVHTMEARSLTYKYETDLPVIDFWSGDGVSVRVIDQGDRYDNIVVHLIYKVIEFEQEIFGGN